MAPDADEGKLFTPRYADGPRGGPKSSLNGRGPGSTPRRRGADPDAFFEDVVEEEGGHGSAGEGGRGGLRHRPGHAPGHSGPGARGGAGGGRGSVTPRAAHSRRAIVPVDDDML